MYAKGSLTDELVNIEVKTSVIIMRQIVDTLHHLSAMIEITYYKLKML